LQPTTPRRSRRTGLRPDQGRKECLGAPKPQLDDERSRLLSLYETNVLYPCHPPANGLPNAIHREKFVFTELELVGSPPVLAEASKLIDACVSFADIARKPQWPWQVWSTTNQLDEHRALVFRARDSYIASVKPSKAGHSIPKTVA
jgi:hypothetical protein